MGVVTWAGEYTLRNIHMEIYEHDRLIKKKKVIKAFCHSLH